MAAVFATAAIVVPITASPANAATEITFWSWRPEDKVFYEAEAAKFLADRAPRGGLGPVGRRAILSAGFVNTPPNNRAHSAAYRASRRGEKLRR